MARSLRNRRFLIGIGLIIGGAVVIGFTFITPAYLHAMFGLR